MHLLFTSLHNQYAQESWLKALNLHQTGKYFTINICDSWCKKKCHTFPRVYPRKKRTNIHPMKDIQFKVILYIKSNKNTS